MQKLYEIVNRCYLKTLLVMEAEILHSFIYISSSQKTAVVLVMNVLESHRGSIRVPSVGRLGLGLANPNPNRCRRQK